MAPPCCWHDKDILWSLHAFSSFYRRCGYPQSTHQKCKTPWQCCSRCIPQQFGEKCVSKNSLQAELRASFSVENQIYTFHSRSRNSTSICTLQWVKELNKKARDRCFVYCYEVIGFLIFFFLNSEVGFSSVTGILSVFHRQLFLWKMQIPITYSFLSIYIFTTYFYSAL